MALAAQRLAAIRQSVLELLEFLLVQEWWLAQVLSSQELWALVQLVVQQQVVILAVQRALQDFRLAWFESIQLEDLPLELVTGAPVTRGQ